jgi:hypothetical protein
VFRLLDWKDKRARPIAMLQHHSKRWPAEAIYPHFDAGLAQTTGNSTRHRPLLANGFAAP